MKTKLTIEDLIYMDKDNYLCKYIIYRESKKKYIVEKIDIDIGYYKNQKNYKYIEVSESVLNKQAIVDKKDILEILNHKLLKEQEILKETKVKEMPYDIKNYDKIQLLTYELENLNKIIEPTENQLKAIKNTEKAIKRLKIKIDKNKKEYNSNKIIEIQKINYNIIELEDMIKFVKKFLKET